MSTYKLSLGTRLHGQYLIEDDLNKRSAKHANNSMLVAKGTDTELVQYLRISASSDLNVDLWDPIN